MIRAFVVDDEELAVKRLVRLLAETGRVEVAGSSTDPIDALAALNEKPVDILFLDIQMPGMTGFELCRRLIDTNHAIPTILVTAFPNDVDQARALNDGAVCYLRKPVDEEHLREALKSALSLDEDS